MWVEQILKMESFSVGAALDSRGRHRATGPISHRA